MGSDVPGRSAPGGERDRKRRIRKAETCLWWFRRLAPKADAVYPMRALTPHECVAIHSYTFLSEEFVSTCRIPAYEAFLKSADLNPAYVWQKRFLQHLDLDCPGRRWVLKSPDHVCGLEGLFSVFPDARIVQTHRNPLEVLKSSADLTRVLRGLYGPPGDLEETRAQEAKTLAERTERFLQFRDLHPELAHRFVDVNYPGLVADPVATMRRIYEQLDTPLTEAVAERMQRLAANRSRYRGRRASSEPGGLEPQLERGSRGFRALLLALWPFLPGEAGEPMKKLNTTLLFLGLAFLAYLLWKVGPRELWQPVRALGWGVIPLILSEGMANFAHTLGWRHCIKSTHPPTRLPRLFRIAMAGFAINYLTPSASMGGEVTKASLLASNHKGPEAVSSVLMDKLCMAFAHLLLAVLGSLFLLWRVSLPVQLWVAMAVSSGLLTGGMVTFLSDAKAWKAGCLSPLARRPQGGRSHPRKGRAPNRGSGPGVESVLPRASVGFAAVGRLALAWPCSGYSPGLAVPLPAPPACALGIGLGRRISRAVD